MKHMRHIAKQVDDWVRVEQELKGKYAHQFTDAVMDCQSDDELKDLILCSILDKYMFFYTSSNQPHKLTRLMLELLEEKSFEFNSPSPRNNLLEQTIEHLKKGSGLFPTLYKIESIWGEHSSKEFIDILYKRYKEEFKPSEDHFKWVQRYKHTYLNEEVNFDEFSKRI